MKNRYKKPLLALLLLTAGVTAFSRAGEPTEQIRQTTDKLLAVVKDPALEGSGKDAERQRLMREAIDERFDWVSMSRSALGKHWRDLSVAQRTEFTEIFSKLIENTYLSQIESYTGEKILYKGDKMDGLYGVVDVVIVTLRGTNIPVSYRVLKKNDEWLVYDVGIEGVSLVNNYRSQIGAILNNSSYDNLIVKIRAKIVAPPPARASKSNREAAELEPKDDSQ